MMLSNAPQANSMHRAAGPSSTEYCSVGLSHALHCQCAIIALALQTVCCLTDLTDER